MTESTVAVRKKAPGAIITVLKYALVTLLAFVAALAFRRSAGIIAMTPIAFSLCAVAAFVKLGSVIKTVIFAVTVFSVNTVEQADKRIVLTFVALCLLANIVAEASAHLIRNGKKYGFAVAVIGAALCIFLSFYLVGNPFTAMKAQKTIDDYTESKYKITENEVLGKFEFSNIYYRSDTDAYAIDVLSTKYPTEPSMISVSDGVIRDGFKRFSEAKIRESYTLEFTSLLREKFPKADFSVTCTEIALMPGESAVSSKDGLLAPRLSYEIHIGGIQRADDMLEAVNLYMDAIDESNIQYNEIVFKGGSSPWIRRCVRIENERIKYTYDFKLEYIHSCTSDAFDEYIRSFLKF